MTFDLLLKRMILSLDEMLASPCLTVTEERGSILTFLFHGLFCDSDEVKAGAADPQQGITVEMLRRFVMHFREQSYSFVSPTDILKRLEPDGKYALITFDDGYYNNIRALPVLEEFGVPAVFFISSDHVKYEKAFWWDVVFRELRKRNRTEVDIRRAIARYKRFRTSEIELQLRKEFGQAGLNPLGDLDRPFSATELRKFATHPHVFLGNHTKDHAILTNYSDAEIKEQIGGAQNDIREITGKTPEIIAYPNGNQSPIIRETARDFGIHLGIGVWPGKNRLPLQIDTGGAMTMKRVTIWGDREIDLQCRVSRSSVSFYRYFRGMQAKFTPASPHIMRSA